MTLYYAVMGWRGNNLDASHILAVLPKPIQHEWRVTNGQHVCQIVWITGQLQQIGQAIDEGNDAFLATAGDAFRRALDEALRS